MTAIRDTLVNAVWLGRDPFRRSPSAQVDYQGWASDNPLLTRAVDEVRPRVVVEIGVWKGGSVITMAERARQLGLDAVVIAIDTWLGSSEHWIAPEWHASLGLDGGYPSLYRTFEANIHGRTLTDYVLPLPLDSGNAFQVMRHFGIKIDVLHIDGAHDFAGVTQDLTQWWPLLREGGVLLGDDYYPDGKTWQDVFVAFNTFFQADLLENFGGKCWIRKGGS